MNNSRLEILHDLVVHQLQINNSSYNDILKNALWFSLQLGTPLGIFLWLLSWEILLLLYCCLLLFFGILLLESYSKYYLNWIQKLYNLTRWTHKKVENYTEILTLLQAMKKVLMKRKYQSLPLSPINQEVLDNETLYLKMIQENIANDLYDQIEKTKKSLRFWKIALSVEAHWTTELNRVSELQKARVDKQIEQFEELQRVLVRV